jgi:hypothetical protein
MRHISQCERDALRGGQSPPSSHDVEPTGSANAGPALVKRNRRANTIMLTLHGRTQKIADWSRELGFSCSLIYGRHVQGWTAEQTLTTPRKRVGKRKGTVYLSLRGRRQSVTDWARELGVSRKMITARLEKGWSHEKTLTTPKGKARYRRLLCLNGIAKAIAEWSEERGISQNTLRHRLALGWSHKRALNTPAGKPRPDGLRTYNGKTQTIREWALEVGLNTDCIRARLKYGWTFEQALALPVNTRRDGHVLTHNGKSQSIKAWAKELGISETLIRERLRWEWPHSRILTEPVHLTRTRRPPARRETSNDPSA